MCWLLICLWQHTGAKCRIVDGFGTYSFYSFSCFSRPPALTTGWGQAWMEKMPSLWVSVAHIWPWSCQGLEGRHIALLICWPMQPQFIVAFSLPWDIWPGCHTDKSGLGGEWTSEVDEILLMSRVLFHFNVIIQKATILQLLKKKILRQFYACVLKQRGLSFSCDLAFQ